MERGQLNKLHIRSGEQQHYQFRTEPGRHYSLIATRSLQQLYFGSQPDTALSEGKLVEINTDFTAHYENYYLSVSSPETRDYELRFDDYVAPKPSPTPCCFDHGLIEKTSFSGKVFDDTNKPLDGVAIRVKSLTSSLPYENTFITKLGTYEFTNAPSFAQVEIIASKTGFASRRRVQTLGRTQDVNGLRYDFGNDSSSNYGVAYNALSDKPEVITVTPGRNSSGVTFNTGFTLKFSEPVDQASVENNFEIFAFNSKKMTVDAQPGAQTLIGPGNVDKLTGTRIWDKEAFHISWNGEHTEVSFSFKPGLFLPTDRDSAKTPDYQVSLKRTDGVIKDKTGASRGADERKFKLTDGDFERSYKFSIKTDEVKPQLQKVEVLSSINPSLVATFSEPMQIRTLALTIAGGLGGNIAAAPAELPGHVTVAQAAENYFITFKRAGQVLHDHVTWASLGGEVSPDPANSNKVLLTKGSISIQSGDEITIETAAGILDPAGNSIDSSTKNASLVVP